MSSDSQMQQFIEEHLARVRPLSRETALAWWDSALTGSDEAAQRAAAVTGELLRVYADAAAAYRADALPCEVAV